MSATILPIVGSVVLTILIVAILFLLNRFEQGRKRARRSNPQTKQVTKIYFVRWLTPDQRDLLQESGIISTDCNLEELRHNLTAPPPSLEPAAPVESEMAAAAAAAATTTPNANVAPEVVSASDSAADSATGSAADTAADTTTTGPEVTPEAISPAQFDPDADGILMDVHQFSAAKAVLDWTVAASISTGLVKDDCEIVELVVCLASGNTGEVSFKDSCSRRITKPERLKLLTTALLSSPLLTPIEISFEDVPAVDDGVFRIIFNGSPTGSELIEAPEKIWGLALAPASRHAHKPSGLGTAIVTDDGYAVAELVGYNLFIHHDPFLTNDFEQAAGLYTRILQKLLPLLSLPKLLDRVVKENQGSLDRAGGKKDMADGKQDVTGFKTTVKGLGRKEAARQIKILTVLSNRLLVQAIGKNVVISQGGGTCKTIAGGAQDCFNIVLWSSPLGTIQVPAPTKLFGLNVGHNDQVFLPSGSGVPLTDSAGYLIAELVADTLYVHFDLVRSGSVTEARIFARLLVAAQEAYIGLRKTDEERVAEARLQYVQTCLVRTAPLVGAFRESDQDNLSRVQSTLHELVLQTRQEEQALYQLEAAPGEALGVEFDRLLDVASVRDVAVSDSVLTVTTDLLYCRDPRTGLVHEIGAFDIEIPTHGTGAVKWFNRTRKVHGYSEAMHAPHVFKDGSACLGNVKDLFPQLIAKRDFASAVLVAIAFIESVNVKDPAGERINYWPVARR